jgi:hypothetical protein
MVNSPHEDAYIESMGLQGILAATDRWSFKPAITSLMAVAALELLCQIPGSLSFLLIPLSSLGYCIALIIILVIAVYCVTKNVLEEELLSFWCFCYLCCCGGR